MRKRYPLSIIIALMLIIASATFIITLFAVFNAYGINTPLFEEVRKYQEAREIIEKYYVGQYDDGELTDASISAAVDALGDKWSFYMTAEEHQTYQKSMENKYEGIGIAYRRTEEGNDMLVTSVSAGSPAEEAGIQVGETIKQINSQAVSELENEEIRELILSQLGSVVALSILDAQGNERTVQVECKEYYSDPISCKMLDDSIGYVCIANFDSESGQGAISAIESLIDQGAEGLVFDVRANGGGLVTELLELLDYLLPEGDIFVTADRAGEKTVKTSDEKHLDMPMAVLVNENSYSAAEFFGAILQEYDWAKIVGSPTTGKGRSQITLAMSDGSAIHISSKTYYTPNGVDLSETGGIVPDYIVEEDFDSGSDLQLEKAAELLK